MGMDIRGISSMDDWRKRWEEEHSCKCPYCGHDYQDDSEFLGEQDLITYHGSENGPVKVECGQCDKEFYIEERVDRTYTTGKELDNNNDIKEDQ